MAHGDRVAQDFDAELAEKRLGQRAGRDARGCFARRSAFENVARIVKIEFLRAGKIGVAGARRGQAALRVLGAVAIFDRQRLLPIFPVAILDAQRDGRADRLAVAHAGEDIRLVLLDSLAAAAAVSQLAAVQFAPTNSRSTGTPAGNPEIQATSACP